MRKARSTMRGSPARAPTILPVPCSTAISPKNALPLASLLSCSWPSLQHSCGASASSSRLPASLHSSRQRTDTSATAAGLAWLSSSCTTVLRSSRLQAMAAEMQLAEPHD